MSQILASFAIGLAASIVGVLIVLCIESKRRPAITMCVGERLSITQENNPLGRPSATFVRVAVSNKQTPRWLAWVYDRNPALSCRAWITFNDLVDKKPDGSRMSGRWADTAQPILKQFPSPKPNVTAIALMNVEHKIDIAPKETVRLDVAVKFKEDGSCFGFCNESYVHNWRHPEWKLSTGVQQITVSVQTGGRSHSRAFNLHNTDAYTDFHLEGPFQRTS